MILFVNGKIFVFCIHHDRESWNLQYRRPFEEALDPGSLKGISYDQDLVLTLQIILEILSLNESILWSLGHQQN